MKKYYIPVLSLILCFTIGCQSQSESSVFAQSGSSSIEPERQEKSSHSSVAPDHLFSVSIDGYTGFIDRTGKVVISFQFGPRTEEFSEGLCAVEVLPPGGLSESRLYDPPELTGKRFGYIDLTGKMVIAPEFFEANSFSDGVAIVEKDSQTGWIDHKGNFVHPLTMFEDVLSLGFRQNRLWVSNSFLQTYFIDKTGKTVIKPTPDRFVGEFHDGFAQVRPLSFDPDEPPQFINLNGKVAFKNLKPFDCITDFSEGLAAVSPAGSKKFGYINTQGKYVIPPVFRVEIEQSSETYGPLIPPYSMFSDGLAVVPQGNKYGFIDKTGKVVIPAVFDEAFPFSEGFAYVTVGLESYFIDKKGKKAIVPEKEPRSNGYFSRFRHGLAADDVGYIDTTGKYVWKCPPGAMCGLESEE